MKYAIKVLVPVAFALTTSMSAVQAQSFGKLPGIGGGKATESGAANPADVAKNTRNALFGFAKAEAGLAAALGGYTDLAAQQALLDGLKVGDAAAKKDDVETLVIIHKSASEAISKKVAENAQLDASNKAQAGMAMVDYVKGLVASKKLIASVQSLVKNPLAMGGDASTLIYAGKELPGIVSSGASTTGSLFKYLGANGVPLNDAKEAAKDLGV